MQQFFLSSDELYLIIIFKGGHKSNIRVSGDIRDMIHFVLIINDMIIFDL